MLKWLPPQHTNFMEGNPLILRILGAYKMSHSLTLG